MSKRYIVLGSDNHWYDTTDNVQEAIDNAQELMRDQDKWLERVYVFEAKEIEIVQ